MAAHLGDEFVSEPLICAARVVSLCADGVPYFVGRSLDSLFGLLSGMFSGTTRETRLRQLPLSLRGNRAWEQSPHAVDSFRQYLTGLELSPRQVASWSKPTVLVDIVDTGRTPGELVTAWHTWSSEAGVRWEQVRDKLQLVGITWRNKTSPGTWRWWQHVPWVDFLRLGTVRDS